jgi:hypothetical protein
MMPADIYEMLRKDGLPVPPHIDPNDPEQIVKQLRWTQATLTMLVSQVMALADKIVPVDEN